MNNILLLPVLNTSRTQGLIPFNFHILRDDIQLDGYQLYAVEKWIVDRKRTLPVLAVYTGHPEHTIPVVSLAPDSAEEWDKAIHYLRRDGARPKQTPHGIIMNTSLAGFRSDFTIVYIPGGYFGAVKDQLYTNINLLRMGCSGRSALTLEEPSDTTKDRFISMYHLPEFSVTDAPLPPTQSPSRPKPKNQRTVVNVLEVYNTLNPHHASASPLTSPGRLMNSSATIKTKDKLVFNKTVLELVKFIQSALAIFGMYDTRDDGATQSSNTPKSNNNNSSPLLFDGLLCDVSVEGIQRWTIEIGEPCANVEPMERVADPSIVSALLSMVLATRNKLAALGYSHVPKDPFLHSKDFLLTLGIYVLGSGAGGALTSPSSASTLTFHSPSYSQTQIHFATANFPVSMPPPRPGHHRSLSNLTLPSTGYNTGSARSQVLSHHPDHSSVSFIPTSANTSKKNLLSAPLVITHLSRPILTSITSVYESKIGPSGDGNVKGRRALSGDGGKVRKTLKSKLGDIGNAVGVGDKDKDRERESDREMEARGAMSEGEGDRVETKERVFAGIAPTHILSGLGSLGSGIGNLASGIGLGLGLPGSGGSSGGSAALVVETLSDLSVFVEAIVPSGERESRLRDRKREKERTKIRKQEKSDDEREAKQSLDGFGDGGRHGLRSRVGVGRGRHGRAKDRDGSKDDGLRGVAGSVVALWSGRVTEMVKLREFIEQSQCTSTPGAGTESDATVLKDRGGEKKKRRDSDKGKWPDRWALGAASDGDVERADSPTLQRARSGDGHRSTEDESDNVLVPNRARERPTSIGSGWSGVRDKLGSWRQIAEQHSKRKKEDIHQLRDGTRSSTEVVGQSTALATGYLTPPRSLHGGRTQSPTLYPFLYHGDDDDLLSSGQVSPVSDRPDLNPFHNFNTPSKTGLTSHGPSATNSSLNLFVNTNAASLGAIPLGEKSSSLPGAGISDYDKKVQAFDEHAKKRPWGKRPVQSRVISWSDPLSARGVVDLDEDEDTPEALLVDDASGTDSDDDETDRLDANAGVKKRKYRRRNNSVGADVFAATGSADEDDFLEKSPKQRRLRRDMIRRRSFHDLDSFRHMRVLAPDQLRIDVELSGQYLIMSRREEHLSNVIKCLEILSTQLSATNASLRSDYQDHLTFLSDLESYTKILASLEASRAQCSVSTQETNTLYYESEQFRLHEMWRTASVPRRKVLAMREKVFGAGGRRRLKQGVHGAHGKFDRVQWRLDGGERLVDALGRTESEAEEEMAIEQDESNQPVADGESPTESSAKDVIEEETDAVEHPTIKPMWLLQFFTNWGARWGAVASTAVPPQMTDRENSGSDSSRSKDASTNADPPEPEYSVNAMAETRTTSPTPS